MTSKKLTMKSSKKKTAPIRSWLQEILTAIDEEVSREDADNARRKQLEHQYSGDDTFAHDFRDAMQALLRTPRIESVWQALERRSDPNATTRHEDAYRKGLESAKAWLAAKEACGVEPLQTLSAWCLDRELRILQEVDEQLDYDVGRHIYDMAYDLVGIVTEIRSEPVPTNTASKRRGKLQEVTELADQLKRAIQPLYGGARQHVNKHLTQSSALDEHAVGMANQWIEPHAILRFCEIDKEAVSVAYQLAKNIVRHPNSVLDALVADVAEWASETPELAKPNDSNAERLFLSAG